ncbi:MAG: M1 family metallopeptidase [Planctomycetes bacterium]|nr:M1 family metallopeptidase [Planctomycetota bacterium]
MRVDHRRNGRLALAVAVAGLFAGSFAGAQDVPVPTLPTGPFPNRFEIVARLDDATKTLACTATITFTNLQPSPVTVVPFHLYPNAWSRTDTAWVKDGRSRDAILERGERDGGYLRIVSIADGAGADLAAATAIDESLMRVTLTKPLAQGESFTFVIAFETKLPRTVARMGKTGDHLDVMQWFPKPCAHVDDRFVDWPFRNPSEFMANFGDYTVTLTTPTRYVVDATGVPGPETVDAANGMRSVTYRAAAVHDFAWCADPHFVVHRETLPGGPEIVLLNQPFLEQKAQLTLDSVKFALQWTGEKLFPYPYPRLVIDVTPMGQGGGMEYPMLFTISASAPEALPWLRSRSEAPSSVTIHEFVHQYFQGMVATNEFEEAWLDEGFTTYVQNRILADFWRNDAAEARGWGLLDRTLVLEPLLDHGSLLAHVAGYETSPFRLRGRKLFGFDTPTLRFEGRAGDRFRDRMASYAPFAHDTVLDTPSWDVLRAGDRDGYRATAYSKPALFLRTLEGALGQSAFDAILREWARTRAFSHPKGTDFIALVNARTEGRLAKFVERAVHHGDVVDWAIAEVRCERHEPAAGFARQARPGDPMTASFPQAPPAPTLSDRILRRLGVSVREPTVPSGEAISYVGEVLVRNLGTLPIPTTVELRFADGSVERRAISGDEPWVVLTTEPKTTRLVAAIVDPDRAIALDLDWTNNGRLVQADVDAGRAFAAWARYWAQSMMSTITWAQ